MARPYRHAGLNLLCLVFAGTLSACAGHPSAAYIPAGLPERYDSTRSLTPSHNERLIYDFPDWNRGGLPLSGLVAGEDGEMYGATLYGGTGPCNDGFPGCGAVFKLTPRPGGFSETTAYNFQNNGDGSRPLSLVRDSMGVLYGLTTSYVSPAELFRLVPSGGGFTETTLYVFGGDQNPWGKLTLTRDGSLYGTNQSFGSSTWGMIFRFTPSGAGFTEHILYNFTNLRSGVDPTSPLLVRASGVVYGTTSQGGTGTASECLGLGCGTIFKLTPSGNGTYSETVLYNFKGTDDGAFPTALVSNGKGTLYGGGTESGGYACVDGGCGTLFSFDLATQQLKVLHRFGRSGLWWPNAQLVFDRTGALYGTTAQNGEPLTNDGGVFKLTPSPTGFTYTTLHTFAGPPSDGQFPRGGLLLGPLERAVYGTTYWGGYGAGTVFEVRTGNAN